MEEYVFVHSAASALGIRAEQTLRNWINYHQVEADAVMVDKHGNRKPIYKMEKLRALKELHEKDVKERGAASGRITYDYTPLEFKVTREQVGGHE